jgi:Na+/H+ antiporter 1
MRYDASLHRRGSATHHDPIAHPHGETKSMRRPAAVASRGAYRWRHALPRLSQFAIEHLLVLPVGALVALVWANTRPESYYQFSYTWSFLVNDVVMVLFFGIITKEIVEAAIPGGVLHPWRRLALPLVASGGGFAVAALVFLTFVPAIDEPMLAQAWPVVGAIDLAAIYFVARITFGLHPVLPFVLLLGIVANGICFLILAVFYPSRDLHLLSGAVLMAAAIGMGFAFRRARVRSFWPYVLGGRRTLLVCTLLGWPASRAGSRPDSAVPPTCSARSGIVRRRGARRTRCAESIRTLGALSDASSAPAVWVGQCRADAERARQRGVGGAGRSVHW